jgi:hypothetical protein
MPALLGRRPILFGLLAATVCFATVGRVEAQQYVRVEEDWELILNTPDLSFPAPQIIVAMKPRPTSNKTAIFLINHHDTPEFQAGGGQIQVWEGDLLRSYKSFAGPTLVREGERVTWTQYMRRDGGKFEFGLSRVEGDAWGVNTAADLGGPVWFNDGQPFFTNYDSNASLHGAAITFGADRVRSLKLLAVRKYKTVNDPDPDVEPSRTVYPSE